MSWSSWSLSADRVEGNLYDYEKKFVELCQRQGREYMEKQMKETSVTENRRKKKRSPGLEK
jgi:hypothetical protein